MAGVTGGGAVDVRPFRSDDIRADNPRRRSVNLIAGLALSPVGAVDTVARSVINPTASVLNALGADVGEVDSIVPEGVGIYHRNRDVARATGEIGVAVAESIYAPGLILKRAGPIAEAAKRIGLAPSIVAKMTVSEARTQRFVRAMRLKDETAAVNAGSRGMPFTPLADRDGITARAAGLFGKSAEAAGDTSRAAAVRRVRQQKRGDEVKQFIAAEIAINATLNESYLLFGEEFDLGDALVGAAFTALPIGTAALSSSYVSRTSLSNAQTIGDDALRQWKKDQRAAGAFEPTSSGGFTQGYDAWTGTLSNAKVAGTALEAMKTLQGDDLASAENLFGSARTSLKEQVLGHNKTRPFQYRHEPPTKATGPTGGLSNEQASAVVDALVERSEYTVALAGVYPISQWQVLVDAHMAKLDDATRGKNANVQNRNFLLDHEMSIVERDGTIVDATGANRVAKEKDLPFAMARRQSDFRDTNSLNVTRNEADKSLRLADHSSMKVHRDGALEIHGKPVKAGMVLNTEDATAVRAMLEGIDAGGAKAAPTDPAFFLPKDDDHFFKLSWLASKLEDGTITTAQTGGSNSLQLRARAMDQQFETLKDLATSGQIDTFLPIDLSKATGIVLHNRENEFTVAAEILLLTASQTNKSYRLKDFGKTIDFVEQAKRIAADVGIVPSQMNKLTDDLMALMQSGPSFNTRQRRPLRAGEDEFVESPSPSVLINRVAQRPPSALAQAADALSQQAVRHRKNALSGPNAHWLVRNVTEVMRNNTIAHRNAQDVPSLHHSSLKWQNALTTREAQASDSPVLQAATILAQESDRVIDRASEVAMRAVTRAVTEARKKGNEHVLAQHSAYTSAFRSGQTMKADIVGAGKQEIDMSLPGNRAAVQRLFRNNPAQAAKLLQPNQPVYMFDAARAITDGQYIPIDFDDQAARLIGLINQNQYDVLNAHNTIRAAVNKAGVNQRTGHVPPENFNKKHMRFFRSEASQGKVIGFVAADTAEQAKVMAHNAQKADPSLVLADEISIQQYIEYYDDIYAGRVTDFRNPLLQTGPTKNLNLSTNVDVSGDTLVSQLESIRDGYRRAGAMTRKLEFEQALNYNKRAQEQSGIGTSAQGATRFSPWEEYERIINGFSNIAPDSFVGKANEVLTEGADQLFAFAAEKLGLGTATLSRSQRQVAERLYKNGASSQFFSSMEDAFNRAQVAVPWKGANLARKQQRVNKAVATATLRFGQIGHGVLNLTSLLVTAPAVARRLVRDENESVADFKARLGGIADYIDDDIATINPTKLMADGIKAMFNPSAELRAAYQAAANKGYFEAKVMEELQDALYRAPPGQIGEQFDRMIEFGSKISDGSEVMSRRLAWGMGYTLSKRINKNRALSDEDHYSFSHWFANQVIGNYDPKNRPDIFRGVSGTSAGLFQTFVVNYMQRIVGMIEKKEHRSLAVQGLTQSGMFGVSSVPGYEQISSLIGNQSADEENLTDRLYNIYGKTTADVLWMGTLSNLPKLFPGEQAGIGFYTRGGVSPQIPNIVTGLEDLPVYKIATDALEGVRKGVNELRATGTISRQRLAELTAAYAPVRGARSLMEVIMGQAVNRNGDLIDGDTHTFSGVMSAMLGSKTADATKLSHEVWKNYGYSRKHDERVKRLSDAYVSWLRQGEGKIDPKLEAFFKDELLELATESGAKRIMKNAQDKARRPLADRRADKLKNAVSPLRLHRMTENDFAAGYED